MKFMNDELAQYYKVRGGIFVTGRSLGGAVATSVVSDEKTDIENVDGLILENTFTNISDMVDEAFYALSFFKWLIQRMFWPTSDLIKDVAMPILFVTGRRDEIVPHEMTFKLHELAENASFKM